MRPQIVTSGDNTTILSFLAKFEDACRDGCVLESVGVWCFRLYAEGPARSLALTRLTRSLMAEDSDRSGMFQTYGDAEYFLFGTYTADKVIREAYVDSVNFRQNSATTEKNY